MKTAKSSKKEFIRKSLKWREKPLEQKCDGMIKPNRNTPLGINRAFPGSICGDISDINMDSTRPLRYQMANLYKSNV